MNKKIILLPLFLLTLSSCGSKEQSINSIEKHTHTYDTNNITWNWNKSSTGYDVVALVGCSACDEITSFTAAVDSTTNGASCTAAGKKTYTATVVIDNNEYSDTKEVDIPALNHNPSNDWEKTSEKHYHLCTRCNEHLDEADHEYGEWRTTIEPELGKKGERVQECTVCSYKVSEEIAALVPSIAEIQTLIDKVVNAVFPYSYQFVDSALNLYQYLPANDKASITHYDEVMTIKNNYEALYDCVSDVSDRTVRKQDADGLGYAGTWEGETSKSVDNKYGSVDVLNIQTVGTGWGSEHFNGISFTQDIPNFNAYKELTFSLFNPNETNSNALIYTNGWYRVPDESTSLVLKPGWNSFTFTIKNGAYNSKDGYHDVTTEQFTILLTNNQVADGWMISNFYGKKSSVSEINEVIALIDALPDASNVQETDREAVEAARTAYDSLTSVAKSQVTNYAKLVEVENALSNLSSNKVIDLINQLPELDNIKKLETFAKLDAVESEYEKLTDEAKAKVTNFSKYESVKTQYDSKYKVLYNPRTYKGVAAEGVSHATYTKSYDVVDTYGPVLRVSATVNKGFSQFYAYNFPNITFKETDVLDFAIYSSFETIDATSQTFWVGDYGSANKVNLNSQGWTLISGTTSSFNTNNKFPTSLNMTGVSFINIQRWADDSVLPNQYTGYYYLSAIIATIN